jgi:regulator of sigma E protease
MIGLPELKPIVADVVPDSMAQQAGIKAGDKIMAVDGKKTSSWQDVRFALLDKLLTQKDFIIKVQTTDGHDANLTLSAVDNQLLKDDGDVVENVGLKVWPLSKPEIETVAPGRAAEAAGIVSGDIVKTIDGRMIQTWQEMAAIIVESPGIELVIEVERDGSILEISITPDEMERDGQKIGQIGVSQMAHGFVFVEYPFAEAVVQGCVRSWDMSLLLLRTIGAMITGQVSLKNVNGPITIAEVVGKAASIGLGFYLNIIAIVSISLAVLNLLPIPLLDGGHLFFCAIEAIKGSPVSTVAIEFGQRIGIVVIGCLMVLAIYNDLVRWLLR